MRQRHVIAKTLRALWATGLVIGDLMLAVCTASAEFTNINAAFPGLVNSSIALGDYDNDGWLDILLTGSTAGQPTSLGVTQLWRNQGDGTFTNTNLDLPQAGAGSAAWGDFNNDGRLDLLLTGYTTTGSIAQIWQNMGDGTFSNVNAALPGVTQGAAAWGDYDNDGRTDILLTGSSITGHITQIYRNSTQGFVADFQASLPGVYAGSVAWGDYDNDGWLDILLTGATGAGLVNDIWRNLANGSFTNLNAGLPGVTGSPYGYHSSAVWGDYDNDGRLDIAFTGRGNFGALPTEVWRNLGNGTFLKINSGLRPKDGGSLAWGDFDNDGLLDIGFPGSSRVSEWKDQIWRNLGNGTFTNANSGVTEIGGGSVALGDFDNDSRLDLVLTGILGNNALVSQAWRNLANSSNTMPSSPAGLTALVSGAGVILSWNAANDAETPASGLTYNLRVGTSPGTWDILAAQADAMTGHRRVPSLGNAQSRLFSRLASVPPGDYYWSVHAVDSAFTGGPFAAEARFTVGPAILRDSSLGMSNGEFGFNLNWKSGTVAMVEVSTNLLDWVAVWTNSTSEGPAYFSDPATGNHPHRFYRAMKP